MVLWVFGYGSLIWKAGFNYDERVVGYIKGFKRVFHQGSTDHRGTPECPGRTATLVAEDGAICWGAAYRVSGHDNEQLVLSYLDVREKQYDRKVFLDIYTEPSAVRPARVSVLAALSFTEYESHSPLSATLQPRTRRRIPIIWARLTLRKWLSKLQLALVLLAPTMNTSSD